MMKKNCANPSRLLAYEDTEKIFQALEAGASGYFLKRSNPAKLLQFIQEVREGGAKYLRS